MRAGRRFQRREIRAVGMTRHGNQSHVMRAQLLEQYEVAGILHQHRVPGREQDARQQVEGVRCAVGGDDVGGWRGDAVLQQARGDLLAQLTQSLRRARQPRAGTPAAHQARQHARGARLQQPALGQEARAGGDDVPALLQALARELQGIRAELRQGFDGGERRRQQALGDEESAPGARLDHPAGDQPVVGVHHREGAGADLAGELADRRQTRARRQLPVPHQLCDALADLIDQRLVRIAAQLEHLKPSASGSPHLSIMTAVVANARAMARLNARRPRGAASRPRSELPNSAQTVMHGTPMPSMIPAM